MSLQKISLQNFRNFSQLQVHFHDGLNVIEGQNAQGKTNLLEAIYFLAHGKSFRLREILHLVRIGQNQARLGAQLKHQELMSELNILITPNNREVLLQGKPQKSFKKVHPIFRVLLFTPDSTNLFKSSPTTRRRYFDLALSTLDSGYGSILGRYQKVLRHRNLLLEQRMPLELRQPFDQQWAELSQKILFQRQIYLENLLPRWRHYLSSLTQSHGSLSAQWEGALWKYQNPEIDQLLEALAQTHSQETRLRRTMLGPHRDDLQVFFQNQPVRQVASQGQQRLLVIALKLAEAELFAQKTGIPPVFLLDDIGSELDSSHLQTLMKFLVSLQAQTILTTAQLGSLSSYQAQVFHIKAGEITP